MNDRTIARITGAFGLACVGLTFGQFPLWLVGSSPSVYDGHAFAAHLFDIKNVAFARILMDQGTDFYQRGRGFSTNDLIRVVNRISRKSYECFFSRYVSGTDVPPFQASPGFKGSPAN